MAIDNTSIGSVLTIPDGLLKNLEKVDERLDSIKKKAKETETVFNASFKSMNGALDPFLPNLQKIVDSLKSAATQSKKMGDNMDGAVKGVNNLNGSITAAIEVINRMRTLIQNPTPNSGNFMSHVSTLVDAISVRISGMGTKFKDFKKQLLELDTAAIQQAMKAQSDAKIRLINEQTATILAKENLEQKKQNRLYAQAATEAAKLARAEAQLAQARAMAATAQERATAANERAARRATIRQYGADATSAMSYVNSSANTGTFNQRAIAIKVLEEAIKNLNKTDKDYQKNLQELSNKYRELKAEQDKVVGSYREMQQHHRSLMDTTGQLQRAFALMFSVSQIRGYINQIAQVRGEFELQQRSLEAILQNKTEADAIFNKTVALAVQSPFQIKDLISYTKQLAAYRIESDKLYDTTKRLADVSAGLGVDMQRLILAYGQVKAAAYLRGTEVRQFTEAGINLYGELQAYFKEVKGEAYTTAQIVDMISKRMVTFEDVEAIFRRITDQGGIFYNMQAIQAETLQGKIANLKDSIDVMLNSIGYANEGMYKFAIDGANVMIRNWQLLADVGMRLIEVLALIKLQSITTGRAMGATFLDIAKFQKLEGIKNTIGLLSVSFKNFGRALYAAGAMAKAAMAQFLPLLLLFEAWQAISRGIDLYSEYNKQIRESTQAYADETAKINKVTDEIKKLQKAREDAVKSNDKQFDYKQNWEMQKSNLQTLYERLKEEKLEVPLELSKVTQENIDEVVEDARKKLQLGYKMIADTQRELSGGNNNFFLGNGQGIQSILPDNFDTDMNDLENAAADVRSYATRIQASIALVGEQYNHLDEVSKKAYDSIKDGARKGEVDVNYVIRAYGRLEAILNGYAVDNPMLKATREQFNDYAKSIYGLKTQIEGVWQFNSQKETATKQLQSLFDSIDAIYGAELAKLKPAEVKVEFNKVATAAKLQDLERYILLEIAAKKYKFKVEGDEDDLAKQLNWVDDYIRKYFAGRKYSATISLQTNVDAMEDFIKKGDAEAKIAQTAKKFVDRFSKSVKKNAKKVIVDESLLNLLGTPYKIGSEVDASIVLARAREVLAKATDLAKNGYGVDPFDKNGTKAEKAQRDLIKERIEAYKELQSQYEKYLKMYDKETAKTKALESLKYKLQNAGIYGDAVGIFPDEKTIAEKIKGLAAQYKDLSKRGDAYKIVADLILQIDQEQLKKELDAAKNQIDDAFNGLNVYTDLKKMGLGESDIAKMFGDLPKTFDDVQKKIAEVYNGKEGEDWAKQRQETEKKLQEQVVKYNLDTFKELTKAYKTNLSDQLQLDAWYYEERKKIMEQITDPEMRSEYLSNLDKKYEQKSSENTWKAFKGSDSYLNMFDNLENVSTKAIERMKIKLEGLKERLKDLDPTQLKEVMTFFNKMDESLVERKPLKSFIDSMKKISELRKQGITEDSLNVTIADREVENAMLEKQISNINKIILLKKDSSKITEKEKDFIEDNNDLWSKSVDELKVLMKTKQQTVSSNKDEISNANANLQYYKTARQSLQYLQTQWGMLRGMAQSAMSSINTLLQSMGVETDSVEMNFANMVGSLADLAVQAVMFGLQLQLCAAAATAMGVAINSALGPIGWAVMALQGVVTVLSTIFGNKDKKLQKQIEEQERAIKRLQWAYEDLKESMDNAMSAADLLINKDDMIDNLNATNASLRSMISMEQSKKHTDRGKIDEWQRQIQENNKAIKELEQTVTEQMGGFGSDSNFKSAAQEFADAWVDAFNEGSDALEALEGKFDDYFNNLLKKQLMMRAADTYIKPILAAFDAAVAEGSAGGNNGLDVTEEELNRIKELKDTNLALFDEYAKGLMEILGVSPTTSASLSDLQQGIQSLSESTGQALESLLNSIRFFVAQQSTDVAAIRQLLAAGSSLNTTTDTNTPMLKELQAQTNYLSKMYSLWSSVIKSGGHPKAGAGIKVFQD